MEQHHWFLGGLLAKADDQDKDDDDHRSLSRGCYLLTIHTYYDGNDDESGWVNQVNQVNPRL